MDDYLINRPLGSGAFGSTSDVTRKKDGKKFCLKGQRQFMTIQSASFWKKKQK
jgi:hypothetical protein